MLKENAVAPPCLRIGCPEDQDLPTFESGFKYLRLRHAQLSHQMNDGFLSGINPVAAPRALFGKILFQHNPLLPAAPPVSAKRPYRDHRSRDRRNVIKPIQHQLSPRNMPCWPKPLGRRAAAGAVEPARPIVPIVAIVTGTLSQSLPRLRLASFPKKYSIYLYMQGKRDGERDPVTIETIATIGSLAISCGQLVEIPGRH